MTDPVRNFRVFPEFDKVRFKGPGLLKIDQGDNEALRVQAPDYVMERIQWRVVDGELQLGYDSPKIVSIGVHREKIVFHLTVRDMKQLKVTGLGKVVVTDLDNDQVRVSLSGFGQVALEHLTADRLDVTISGAGSVSAKGDVESQSILISGAGEYKAPHLVSDFAHVKITGAGAADISVSEDLDVLISGAGQVTYAGYPEIVKRISALGQLTRRRRRQQASGEEHG